VHARYWILEYNVGSTAVQLGAVYTPYMAELCIVCVTY